MTLSDDTFHSDDSVGCLKFPLIQGSMLIPCLAVAEVTGGSVLKKILDNDALMVRKHICGVIDWHQGAVAVYAYEALLGLIDSAATLDFQHCVIMKPYYPSQGGDFAFATQGLPEISVIRHGDLWLDDGESHEYLAARVRLNGEQVMIPDLPKLSSGLSKQHGRVLDNAQVFG